jgi:hypothetical protein
MVRTAHAFATSKTCYVFRVPRRGVLATTATSVTVAVSGLSDARDEESNLDFEVEFGRSPRLGTDQSEP